MPKDLNPLTYTNKLYTNAKLRLTFSAHTKVEARAWQARLQRQLIKLLGCFPQDPSPLRTETLASNKFVSRSPEGIEVPYHRENIMFCSRENVTIFGYFLKPLNDLENSASSKLPCIICLPGHGRGVDEIVGIKGNGSLRKYWGGYHNDYALQCVSNGFTALAIEQLGFGHRRDEAARMSGLETTSCQPVAGAALLLGHTMIGWRVYDVIRAIDYLLTREEVDKERIGVMGLSGGGTTALFSAALDRRLKAAVVSGYFNTFKDSIMSVSHCIDNYVPGILDVCEMYDVAGLIAPRFLFCETGTNDPIFPVKGTRIAYRKARSIYRLFDVPNRIGMEVFDGEHVFWGKKAFKFLKRNL